MGEQGRALSLDGACAWGELRRSATRGEGGWGSGKKMVEQQILCAGVARKGWRSHERANRQ